MNQLMKFLLKHIVLALLLSAAGLAQTPIIVNGTQMTSAKEVCRGCILVTGDVRITQKDTKIKCMRAIWDKRSNTVDATGNVRIYRKGSAHPLHGDKLHFNGNTSLARLRENVYYDDGQISFTTEKFNYNTLTEQGYYFDGGIVKDSVNTLVSERGYVFKNDDVIVKDSVIITTPDYRIEADSLMYNSSTQIVTIIAPTTMYADSGLLYAEGGYYKTDVSYAYLTDNAYLEQGSYKLNGDIITYHEKEKIGEGFGHVEMNDTVQEIILKGHYLYHDGHGEHSFVTDSAQALLYAGVDTLFAHADTLFSYVDTAGVQYFSGYRNVRFFRLDVQGKCDSLVYCMADSVATMYYEPMLWSLYNQMSGEIVKIYNKNNRVSHLEMLDDAFIVSREDSIRFNQVRGKTITGCITHNDLRKIQVDGSAESIYYSREGEHLVGYNKTESSYLTISLADGKITRLSLQPASTGMFYSLDSKPYEEQFLRGFHWRSDLRPTSPLDIFRRTAPPQKEITKGRRRRRN